MNILEQKLATALAELGRQYAADVNSLSQQVQALSLRLDEQSSASAKRIEGLSLQLERQSVELEKQLNSSKDQFERQALSLAKGLESLNGKLTELAES